MLKFYMKPLCGACRKARIYIEKRGIDFEPIDIVKDPPPRDMLARAIDPANPKASLNTRAAAFRRRDIGLREITADEALALMLSDPNLIRRPFFACGERVYQGFEAGAFEAFLG